MYTSDAHLSIALYHLRHLKKSNPVIKLHHPESLPITPPLLFMCHTNTVEARARHAEDFRAHVVTEPS